MKVTSFPLWPFTRATVPVAATNALPFPMLGKAETLTPIQLSQIPFSIPLEQGVKWWWRVKSWLLTANFSDIGPFEITLTKLASPYGDERDMCLAQEPGGPARYSHVWSGTYDASLVIPPDTYVRIMNATLEYLPPLGLLSFGIPYAPPDYEAYGLEISNASPETRQLVPVIGLSISAAPWESIGADINGSMMTVPNYPSVPPEDGSDHNGSIDGVTWHGRWEGNVPMPTITWSLVPATWWPYANADDSNPTWDANTGARN